MHLGSRHGLNGYSWMLMYNSLTIQAASFRTPVVPHKSRIIQEVRREKGKLCTMILGQWDRRTCKLPQAPVRHWYFIEAHQISTRSSAATAARSGWAPQGTEPRNDHYREKPSPGPGRGRRAGLVRQLGLAGLFVLLPPAQHTMDTLVAYLKGHIATNGAAWGRALPVPCAGDPGTGEGADVSALLKEFLGFCLWNSGPVFIAQSPSGGNEEERGSPWTAHPSQRVGLRQHSAMTRRAPLHRTDCGTSAQRKAEKELSIRWTFLWDNTIQILHASAKSYATEVALWQISS